MVGLATVTKEMLENIWHETQDHSDVPREANGAYFEAREYKVGKKKPF